MTKWLLPWRPWFTKDLFVLRTFLEFLEDEGAMKKIDVIIYLTFKSMIHKLNFLIYNTLLVLHERLEYWTWKIMRVRNVPIISHKPLVSLFDSTTFAKRLVNFAGSCTNKFRIYTIELWIRSVVSFGWIISCASLFLKKWH